MVLLSSLRLCPGVIVGEGVWPRLDCEAVAHVFVVDLRCGRYAAALGLFPPAVSPLIRSGLSLDSVSGGRGRAATPNLFRWRLERW